MAYAGHILFIDEAHCLLGVNAGAKVSEENADPKSWTTHITAKLVNEGRKHRIGIFLGDQNVGAIAPEILSGLGTVMVFRTTDPKDREAMIASIGGGAYEYEQAARLAPGEAFLFTEGFQRPRLVKTIDLSQQIDLESVLDPEELKELIRDEPWRREAREISERARLTQLTVSLERFDAERLEIMRKAAALHRAWVLHRSGSAKDDDATKTLQEAIQIHDALDTIYRDFRYGPVREWIGVDEPEDSAALRESRADLSASVETAAGDIRYWLDRLETLRKTIKKKREGG